MATQLHAVPAEALALIEVATRTTSREVMSAALFERVDRLIGIDMAALISLEGAPSIMHHKSGPRGNAHSTQQAAGHLQEILRRAALAQHAGAGVVAADELALRAHDQPRAHSELLPSLGACACLTTFLRKRAAIAQCFTIGRFDQTGFRSQEVDVLRMLQPTLSAVVRLLPDLPEPAPGAVSASTERATAEWETLSMRELQIVQLVGRGFQNREIAAICGTSANTVRNQLVTIFRKAGVTTRAELAARVVEANLLA